MKFWVDVGDTRSFQRRFLIVSIKLHAGDIRTQNCKWVAKSSKIGPQFLDPNFLRGGGPKNLLWHFVTVFTPYRVAKFGWVLSDELRLWSLAMSECVGFNVPLDT